MNALDVHRRTEVQEARLLLRWAANDLGPMERAALSGFLAGESTSETGKRVGFTKQGVWIAKRRAIAQMRKRLAAIGIVSAEDLLRTE